jgi:prepilin-type N-terminal cleavage/methylation domain-containing protein
MSQSRTSLLFTALRSLSPLRPTHSAAPTLAITRASRLGMTLIEIMIVVTIMAAIIGTATVYIFKSGNRANVNIATTEAKKLLDQVKQYTMTNTSKKAPSNLDQLVKDGYAEEIPTDPWGNSYTLSVQGNKATITSSGPDSAPGNEDDIVVEGNLR